MKVISISVPESDYQAFREAAAHEGRSVAALVREAMAYYRAQRFAPRTRLGQLPVLAGHRLVNPLPARADIYDEVFAPADASDR